MLSEQSLTIYESWEISKPSIPIRSYLFLLNPIGIGTYYVESLTSYITRLSEAHCLLPRTLIAEIITLNLQNIFAKKQTSRGLSPLFKRANAINGGGDIAQDFTNAVRTLTGFQDLQPLTLLAWSKVLVWQGLLRTHKAWCPACYLEWIESGSLVYDPLLWAFKTVKVCPKHRVFLLEKCPHCQKTVPFLSWRSRNGFCSECFEFLLDLSLGNLKSEEIQSYKQNELEKYCWIANSLGYLLAQSPILNPRTSKYIVRDNIVLAVDTLTGGNITAFASVMGIPKNTFWGWYTGKSFPLLEFLLEISWTIGSSLFELLTGKIEIPSSKPISYPGLPRHTKYQRLSPKNFDSNKVEQVLLNALAQSGSDILTMKQIADSLHCDRRLISRHFPDLCRAIVLKRRNWQKSNFEQTIQDCCKEVRQAVITLHTQGEYPNEARVSELISHPGFFRYQRVRAYLHTVRRELGLYP